MKNKRLLALFIVLVVIVALVILGSTVFTVKTITVVFNEDREITQVYKNKEQQIANGVKDKLLGKSVFMLTDGAIRDMIDDPYIELIRSVVAYPSRVTLHVTERKEMFAVAYGGKYYMTDRYGVVLREDTANKDNPVDAAYYPDFNGKNIEVVSADVQTQPVLGKTIDMPEEKLSALMGIVTSFYEDPARNPTIDLTAQIRGQYLQRIEFVGDTVKINAGRNELDQLIHTIILRDFETDAKQKMQLAWILHQYGDNLRKRGTITVYEENGGYSAVVSDNSEPWDVPN